jgi:replicative DNA helicase
MAKKTTNTKKREQLNEAYGKMPPQAVDLEEAVLGALMLDKEAIFTVLDMLSPEAFYKEAHQTIYRNIVELSNMKKPIDLLTVTESLRTKDELDETGGPVYLTQLVDRVGSAAHIEYHASILIQKHIQRELIRASGEILSMSYDDNQDVYNLLNEAEAKIFEIAEGSIKGDVNQMGSVLKEAVDRIVKAAERKDGLSGVASGYTDIDRITSGWQPSDLAIIAARPAMGKTAFVLSMARNMTVEHGKSVAFFSLEMSAVQLVTRLIVSESELSSEKVKNGQLADYEWEQLMYKIKPLENAKLFIDDTPAISVFDLRAKCRRLKAQEDIDLVIVDYLQLMTAGQNLQGNREQEVGLISRNLKGIAKELDVPILALSQLNRGVEQRTGSHKKPQLADLRESGSIEQDADMVFFIHRPEYYGMDQDEDGNSTAGLAQIIIAKHRNGAVGEVNLRFRPEMAKFSDWDEDFTAVTTSGLDGQSLPSRMNDDDENGGNNDLGTNLGFDSGGGDPPPF